jgi:hypothetical protein
MAEVKNIRLEDFIQRELGEGIDSLRALPTVIGGGVPMGLITLAASLPEGVTTGSELEKESKEDREAKKEKKKKEIATVKGNRAADMTAEEAKNAAERGEYGPIINPFLVIDPDVNKPKVVSTPELTEEEKLPTTTGGVIDIESMINKPLITLPPENIGTNIIGGGFTKTDIPDMSIITMAKIKDDDLVYVGGNINTKLPKYLVDEKTGKLKEEYQKKGDEGEDANKLISMRGAYKLPKYMLDKKEFNRPDGRKDTSYTIKDEYKNPEELKRLENSKKVKDIVVEYYNSNPEAYEIMMNKDITKLGSDEVKNLRQYVIDNHDIDFTTKTYEKILNETFGSRKKEGKRKQPQTDATDKFQTIIRDYSKDKFGETLTNPQVDRYLQEFRIAIETENPDKKKGDYYTDKQISSAANFVIDTVFKGKYRDKFDIGYDRDLTSYIENKLERTAKTKKDFEANPEAFATNIQTIGHYGPVRERIVGEGGDPSFYVTQTLAKNKLQQNLDTEHRTARQNNNIEKMKEVEQKMKDNDIRSMYTDKDGNRIFIGAEPKEGGMKEGGMIDIFKMTKSLRAQR